jgi:hypothetical protein
MADAYCEIDNLNLVKNVMLDIPQTLYEERREIENRLANISAAVWFFT